MTDRFSTRPAFGTNVLAGWRKQIKANERKIRALCIDDPQLTAEVADLERRNAELRCLIRQRAAFKRRQAALNAIASLMLAGAQAPAHAAAELEAAQAEFAAASAEVDRFASAGRRDKADDQQ